MATSALALLDQTLPFGGGGGSDRLSKEIFSILESNFLFGVQQTPAELGACSEGRVRVLSIDGGADGGALAAAAIVRLERRLQELSGNPAARVADYFDLAAGSGAGGFLAAALFARRMTAEQARDVVAKNKKVFSGRGGRGGGLFSSRPDAVFKKAFGDLTVRDAAKPLLIPCYDMATAAPFVFSRADAVEAEAFDFPLWQVCAAACGVGPAEVASLDGRTRLRAAGAGGAGVANPTAVAVTHVLHNKREFPFAAGAGDLVVLSLGGNAAASVHRASSSSSLLRIAGTCQADMVRPRLILQHSLHGQNRTVVTYRWANRTVVVRAAFQVDQAVSMAFGQNRATNYIRIQVNERCNFSSRLN